MKATITIAILRFPPGHNQYVNYYYNILLILFFSIMLYITLSWFTFIKGDILELFLLNRIFFVQLLIITQDVCNRGGMHVLAMTSCIVRRSGAPTIR